MDLSKDTLPEELGSLFDDALEYTVGGKMGRALELCRKIEAAFNYPEPDAIVQKAQIPGGMYTNMMAQMQEAKLEQHLDEVLRAVPVVRLDSGVPPLVTPTSQIVGVQAVNYVVSKTKGEDPYSNVSKNFAELVKGSYGKTPWAIDPEFRLKICGSKEEIPYDTSKYTKQDNPVVVEAGNLRLAYDEKEELLLELFPSVAEKFLKARRIAEWERDRPDSSSEAAVAAPEQELVFEGNQQFTLPAFSSSASVLPNDYEVFDGLDESYWTFAVEHAE